MKYLKNTFLIILILMFSNIAFSLDITSKLEKNCEYYDFDQLLQILPQLKIGNTINKDNFVHFSTDDTLKKFYVLYVIEDKKLEERELLAIYTLDDNKQYCFNEVILVNLLTDVQLAFHKFSKNTEFKKIFDEFEINIGNISELNFNGNCIFGKYFTEDDQVENFGGYPAEHIEEKDLPEGQQDKPTKTQQPNENPPQTGRCCIQ